jgi:pimeloyl-ACP methyl ester carboxylesterase
MTGGSDHKIEASESLFRWLTNVVVAGNACLKPMTSPSNASDAAVIDTGVCPLYLLTGEYDFSCTPEDTGRTAAAIKGASLTLMEQLGHFPMSENPQQFRRYIAPVLSQILGQTTFDKQGEHV